MSRKLLSLMVAGFVGMSLTACSSTPSTAANLEITAVSDAVVLNAPDGFSLSVTVNDPSLVQSYQWQIARAPIIDDDGNTVDYDWYDLNGTSASTDTLVCPSTATTDDAGLYRCMITDTKGNVLYSENTGYTLTNAREPISYIQLGEIAVRAGETVDLADTALGSGTISLNEAGDTAILKDVVYSNAASLYDNELPAQGFCFADYNTSVQEFTLEIQGDCSIDNVMYQEDYNSGGLSVLFNVWGSESQLETAKITGDGTLHIKGGSAMIYADCSVDIDCDLVFDSYENHYTDGIRVLGNVNLHDCTLTSEKLNGRIVFSNYGTTTISNCTIKTDCNIPKVSVGASAYRGISGAEGLTISDSDISFNIALNGEWLTEGLGQAVGLYTEGAAAIDNSTVQMSFSTEGENENLYNLLGLYSLESMTLTNSTVTCKADTAIVSNATGINTQNLTLNDSSIDLDLNASGVVYGVADTGTTTLNNSQLNVTTKNEGTTEDDQNFGMMVYSLNLEGDASSLHITSDDDGIALGIYLDYGEKEIIYDEDYQPTGILDPYTIEVPASALVNESSLPGYSMYTYVETIYAADDLETPAHEVLLTTK